MYAEIARKKQLRKLNFMVVILLGHVAVVFIKFYAYVHTNSAAVFSDALEGIINLIAGLFAYISLRFSLKPPDLNHPYGHGKIEFFAVGFEGALIIFAAVTIIWKSLPRLFADIHVRNTVLGSWILALAMAIQIVMVFSLFHYGRREKSDVLLAEGYHILSDVLTTIAIIAGLLILRFTNLRWIDPLLAIGVAVFILIAGLSLARKSFSGLMDSPDRAVIEKISEILKNNRKDWWIDVHELRARQVGDVIFVDLHVVLPRYFTLGEAHKKIKEVENLIRKAFDGPVEVLIHMDPCEDNTCEICMMEGCSGRKKKNTVGKMWKPEYIVSKE